MKALYFLGLMGLLLVNCTPRPAKQNTFADFFPTLSSQDTLVFAVEAGAGTEASLASADTIATDTFYRYVPDSLRASIAHILDGGDPVIVALGRFDLDAQYEGLGVDIKAFWFRNQSLLVFDKQQQQVVGLLPIAEFYGGDGGQILRASWLIAAPDKEKMLLMRESQHALRIDENTQEMNDTYAEAVARYVWQNGRFAEQSVADSTALIQAFPVKWE
ncbi:MAG: hypothetical protein ACK4TA_24115 [Saprospiraceae bacterium]